MGGTRLGDEPARLGSATVAFVLTAIALLLLVPGGAASDEVHANVSTDQPVELGGNAGTEGAGGILLSPWTAGARAELSAERVHVVTEWERGTHVDGTVVRYSHVDGTGIDHRNLTDVEGDIGPWERGGTLFVEPPDERGVSIDGEGLGGTTIRGLGPGTGLAFGGYSDPDADANQGELPGYEYQAEQPLVAHEGLRSATVTGSFTLFVHNATIEGSHGGGERWENWTGVRHEDQAGPQSEYEIRVTVLHVEDGELAVRQPGGVSLLDRELETTVDGSVAFSQAEGLLDASSQEILLRGTPLELSGSGSLSVSATETGGGEGAGLAVDGRGDFEVLSPEDRLGEASTSASSVPGAATPWLSGLLVASTAVAAMGAVAYRRPRMLRPLPVGLRDRLFWRWMRKGQGEEEERAFGQAAGFYRRSTAIRPSKPMGWYHRTKACLDAGEPRRALEVIDQAADQLEAVPLDLVELEVAGAWSSGEEQRAKEALLELGERAPAMARGLVEDLGLDGLRADADVREALTEEPEPGGLEGYV